MNFPYSSTPNVSINWKFALRLLFNVGSIESSRLHPTWFPFVGNKEIWLGNLAGLEISSLLYGYQLGSNQLTSILLRQAYLRSLPLFAHEWRTWMEGKAVNGNAPWLSSSDLNPESLKFYFHNEAWSNSKGWRHERWVYTLQYVDLKLIYSVFIYRVYTEYIIKDVDMLIRSLTQKF